MVSDLFEKGDPSRWVVLTLFCLFSASNAIQWITYAPIAIAAKEFFGLTTSELNMLSTVYMIVFVVGAYFSSTTFEKWGVRQGLILGCFLNALGSILKVVYGMQRPGFTPLIISQTFNSVAQLFVLSTPPLIASQYFPPPKRALATTIACTANNLGNAVALFFPPFVVQTGTSKEFYVLFGLEMGVCIFILVLVFFFLKPPRYGGLRKAMMNADTLPAAPELVAADAAGDRSGSQLGWFNEEPHGMREGEGEVGEVRLSERISMDAFDLPEASGPSDRDAPLARGQLPQRGQKGGWSFAVWRGDFARELVKVSRTVGKLCRKSDFLFLFGAFSISMGSVWTYASVLSQVLYPFGVSAELAGIAAGMNVVAGTIVSYIVCIWVDRKRRYKFPIIICLTGSLFSCLGLLILLIKAPSPSTLIDVLSTTFVIISGIFQNTTIPVCFEFAMEIAFPLQESVPGSLLMAGANLASFILVSVSSFMLEDDNPTKRAAVNVVILIISVCAVGTLLVLPPRERLNRRDAELLAKKQMILLDHKGRPASAEPDRTHPSVQEEDS
ncbi:unnamed protein product [Phytomonas sp. EM1]|nr:unnamed protein product [Phytomonas sp. EM1]|eukprot:CCW59809.1 unnamed protein product [Phytomonas sp. isolate EM1]